MRVMKKVLALGLLAAIASSAVGCGNSGEESGGGSTDTIRVAIWDNNQLAGLQEIADGWGEENGYTVEFEVLDWNTYWTMLEAGVSGGEMPDVFWMHSQNAIKYMDSGVLLELNDYIDNDDAVNMDNYYEGITDLYTADGVHYALPKDHDTIAVIYNKAIFDKYGVEYPSDEWTWEEYAKTAQLISEKGAADGVYGTYCNVSTNQDMWYDIVYAYGGEIINEDKTASGFDNPATVEAMKFVVDEIVPACPSQDTMASTSIDTMFLSGLIGMECQGSWMINTFATADNASDFGWAMLPYADVNGNGQCEQSERCTIYNGLGWAAYAETKNPDAAWSLISSFCSQENQMKQSELGITMSGYIGCSEPFANAFNGMDVSPFVDVEEKGTMVFRPYSKDAAIWESDNSDALMEAWTNPEKIEEVLQQITKDMNEVLAEE